MAFPAVHYGNFGDEKVTSSSKIGGLPLGTKMVLPDGREFRHAYCSGTAIAVGKVYQTQVQIADAQYAAGSVTVAVAAANTTTVGIKTGGTTAITTDQFADGHLIVSGSAGGGIGWSYKIKSNNSAAAGSTTCTLTLYETDPIKVAIAGGTAEVGVRENPWRGVILTTADTVIAGRFGVSCSSAAASSYVWLQTKGPAACYVAGTAVVSGEVVVASTGVAGAVAKIVASTAGPTSAKAMLNPIGQVFLASIANGYAMVDLWLD
jgi:hypothetical protein